MRIVYVIGTSTGGVGTHVRALARDVAAAGHEVRVIGPAGTDEHFGFSSLPGVRFAALDLGTGIGPGDAALVLRLRTLIRGFDPDIVHAHGFRAGLVALLATRSLGSRISGRSRPPHPRLIISLHNQAGATGLRGKVEAAVERLLARGADLTIGASSDLVERARDLGARDARFVPAAAPQVRTVTAEVALSTRARLASEFGFGEDAMIVLSVGRVAPQKNYPMLVRALGLLGANAIGPDGPGRLPELVFLVAGAADEEVLDAVRAEYRDLAATSAVPALHFLGPREDIAELGAAADMYVLTSVWEARALVLQEALIMGQAIIATRGGGTEELVGEAGVIIDSDDERALARSITELATDPGLREELAERAAARGASLPDEAAVAKELLGVYAEPM